MRILMIALTLTTLASVGCMARRNQQVAQPQIIVIREQSGYVQNVPPPPQSPVLPNQGGRYE